MASTRADLRSDLRTELKKDPNGKIWGDPSLNWYLKTAYIKFQKDGNYEWRENDWNTTYTPSAQETTLPSDFGKVVLVRYNWSELKKTDKITLKREVTEFQSWTPSRYYIYWSNIGTDTIPSAGTVDLDYRSINAFPTDDTTEIAYWDDFDIAIIKYAAFLAWSSIDGKQNTAANELQEYELELSTLYSTYIFDDINDLTYRLQRRGSGVVTQSNVLDR